MRPALMLLPCVMVLFACKARNTENIRVEANFVPTVAAEDIFEKIEPLTLSNPDTVVAGRVCKVLKESGCYYLSDGRSIHIYSGEGEYRYSINRRGRGPGEYFDVLDFDVDDDIIYLIDRSPKLLKYHIDGSFVSEVRLEFYPATICADGNGRLILSSAYQTEGNKFSIFSAETLSCLYGFLPVSREEMTYRHFMDQHTFYRYGNRLLYHETMNNDVFAISEDTLSVFHTFDLMGRNAPDAFWRKPYRNVMEINMEANKRRYCFGMPVYAESDRSVFFTYRAGASYRAATYSKPTGQSVQFEEIEFPGFSDSVKIMDLSFSFFAEDGLIIALPDFVNSQDDNSVKLMLVQIK